MPLPSASRVLRACAGRRFRLDASAPRSLEASMRKCVGLDLGTTNSALAIAGEDRSVTLARFAHRGGVSDTFRSILYFHPDAADARRGITSVAGPVAIDQYLEADGTGRLIQ